MPGDGGSDRSEKFVVDGILPRNLVHLIAAPVGTGKTTLFMQQIHAMQNGLEFLGRKAYRSRIVYITADRGKMETASTCERLGLTGLEIVLVSLKDMRGKVPTLESLIAANCQRGDLVIVEPLNFFLRDYNGRVGDINNFGHVSHFLLGIGREAEDRQITIEGSLHSSKAKQGSEYMVAREKVIGSIAWTAFTATTIVLEPANPTVCDDPGRTIHVLPRDMRPFTLNYTVEPERGLLIPGTSPEQIKEQLDLFLYNHPSNTFTAKDLGSWAEQSGSKATLWRWVELKIEGGEVLRVGRGKYEKRKPI